MILVKFFIVLTQHVEKEPVSDIAFLDDGVDDFSPDQPEPDVQEVGAHLWTDDDDDPIDDDQKTQDGKSDEPEPQKDVDLLVDDVEGQQTESIVFLDLSRRSEFVKSAFGHSWEHVDQWIEAVFLVLLCEGDHLKSKSQKGSVEKTIHQKNLA